MLSQGAALETHTNTHPKMAVRSLLHLGSGSEPGCLAQVDQSPFSWPLWPSLSCCSGPTLGTCQPVPRFPDLEELELLGSAPEEGVSQHLLSGGARLWPGAQHGLHQAPGSHLVCGGRVR